MWKLLVELRQKTQLPRNQGTGHARQSSNQTTVSKFQSLDEAPPTLPDYFMFDFSEATNMDEQLVYDDPLDLQGLSNMPW